MAVLDEEREAAIPRWGWTIRRSLPDTGSDSSAKREVREGIDEEGRPLRKGFDHTTVLAVLSQGGKLSRPEYLRLRIRYLVDAGVLGSREFVNGVFELHRNRFGTK